MFDIHELLEIPKTADFKIGNCDGMDVACGAIQGAGERGEGTGTVDLELDASFSSSDVFLCT